jgi:hypothetical protein
MNAEAMAAASSSILHAHARRGSVVALADQRQQRALVLLVVVPVLLLFGLPGVPFAVLCGLVVALLTCFDVTSWADAAFASRRMAAGQPPVARNLDYGVGRDWTRAFSAGAPYRAVDHAERLAHGSPLAAKKALGANLRRRATWAGLSALACAFVVGLAWPGMRRPDDRFYASVAQAQERIIRNAATSYRSSHPDACPTMEQLSASGKLEADFPTRDPWGTTYAIACTGAYDATVTSAGPDRAPGTADDVVAPLY